MSSFITNAPRKATSRLLIILFAVLASACAQEMDHVRASKLLFSSEDPQEQREGFEFLLAEYRAGSAYSAGKIGWAYQKGLGVEQDINKAVELYEYAAGSGMTYWQFMLAHAHEMGYLGLEQSNERRDYWLNFPEKTHVDVYECWVVFYYENGFFPQNLEVQDQYKQDCANLR